MRDNLEESSALDVKTTPMDALSINTTASVHTLQTDHPILPATKTVQPSIVRRRRRENPILYILTRDERKIQPFPLNQTHGLLMHCNEIRRRQLRDLIYPTTRPTIHVSSAVVRRGRAFFNLVSTLILIFTKISG